MFINDKSYSTNLPDTHSIRYILFLKYYNTVYIEKLKEIISKYIDCLSIDYDSYKYSFIVKIKKTSMRKLHGPRFTHQPTSYYPIISEIFFNFINEIKDGLKNELMTLNQDPLIVDRLLTSDGTKLNNLCHITCISDNILIINL